MALLIVLGVFVLSLVILIVLYFLWRRGSGPLNVNREIEKGVVILHIEAKRPIKKLTIKEKGNKDELNFTRNNLESGEHVEFNYPAFVGAEKVTTIITAECDDGTHEFEV
ncbi:hypothetical protein HYT84_03925 [Candidatus Micrarchaeota archaeon]|nr:hypothetical protein [Candidatus Micrarchaeota archaeon]